jgi:hypothetical protein
MTGNFATLVAIRRALSLVGRIYVEHPLGAVSTQMEYANSYSNCVEHGMAWADTQRPLHPNDTVSRDCKLADDAPIPDK